MPNDKSLKVYSNNDLIIPVRKESYDEFYIDVFEINNVDMFMLNILINEEKKNISKFSAFNIGRTSNFNVQPFSLSYIDESLRCGMDVEIQYNSLLFLELKISEEENIFNCIDKLYKLKIIKSKNCKIHEKENREYENRTKKSKAVYFINQFILWAVLLLFTFMLIYMFNENIYGFSYGWTYLFGVAVPWLVLRIIFNIKSYKKLRTLSLNKNMIIKL